MQGYVGYNYGTGVGDWIDGDGNGAIGDQELQTVLTTSRGHKFSLRTVHLLMYEFTHSNKRMIGTIRKTLALVAVGLSGRNNYLPALALVAASLPTLGWRPDLPIFCASQCRRSFLSSLVLLSSPVVLRGFSSPWSVLGRRKRALFRWPASSGPSVILLLPLVQYRGKPEVVEVGHGMFQAKRSTTDESKGNDVHEGLLDNSKTITQPLDDAHNRPIFVGKFPSQAPSCGSSIEDDEEINSSLRLIDSALEMDIQLHEKREMTKHSNKGKNSGNRNSRSIHDSPTPPEIAKEALDVGKKLGFRCAAVVFFFSSAATAAFQSLIRLVSRCSPVATVRRRTLLWHEFAVCSLVDGASAAQLHSARSYSACFILSPATIDCPFSNLSWFLSARVLCILTRPVSPTVVSHGW
ncbi:hypothetical protein Cgig2_013628 [Carnegiea gigantea]|uniref:Uncharacterized protein n=1 Tax=Carnegiea gigantea TaxID=171969 RepID=A0A9Q1KCM4_9CARY|nr:hypothetical protein Cgig2_013628 [Carnegiea gigantea]